MSRRTLMVPPLLCLLVLSPCQAPACGFTSLPTPTLRQEASQPGARLILFGPIQNARDASTSELNVEAALRSDPAFAGEKVLDLGQSVPVSDAMNPPRYLVFCDIVNKKVDAYRGVLIRSAEGLEYVKEALALDPKDPAGSLKFFFNYLDNADPEISMDAFKEFANADYKDYRDMAKDLPADKLAGWLRDRNTPSFRVGLYGSLLGHCGKDEHAKLLRSLLEDPDRKLSIGVDGVLAGYTMIKPGEGWQYTKDLMQNPAKEFLMRYAGLRAARFFHDFRPDLVSKKELADGVAQLLDQEDIADVAIEDLRKWGCVDMTDRILALQKTDAYTTQPIVRRAVLRFALSFPDAAGDADYVAQQRKDNPQGVADAEEILKLEQGK